MMGGKTILKEGVPHSLNVRERSIQRMSTKKFWRENPQNTLGPKHISSEFNL